MQGSGLSEVNLESRQKDIGTVWRHPLDRHSSTIQKAKEGRELTVFAAGSHGFSFFAPSLGSLLLKLSLLVLLSYTQPDKIIILIMGTWRA